MRSSSGRDDKLHGTDTFGIVKQFLALVIRPVPGSSLAGPGARAAIEIGE